MEGNMNRATILMFILIIVLLGVFSVLAINFNWVKDVSAYFLSALALAISAYFGIHASTLQEAQAENSIWNIALTRIGQLYDQAAEKEELSRLIDEQCDIDGHNLHIKIELTPRQDMWLANLFMALEQVFVSTAAAARDSQKAWKQFLKNQLNKPTIRTAFLLEIHESRAYYKEFAYFTCGQVVDKNNCVTYRGGTIKKEVVDSILADAQGLCIS
jgi:hypothetical protein